MPAKRPLLNGFNRCAARPSIRKLRDFTQPPLLRPSKVASQLLLIWAHSPRLAKAGNTLSFRGRPGHGDSGQLPSVRPFIGAAAVLIAAAIVASLVPAARASRVDVIEALRSE